MNAPLQVVAENSRQGFSRNGADLLRRELYATVHGAKLSVEEMAFQVGVSPSYLYRCCLTGPSGAKLPLELLSPLMRVARNYRALEYLNTSNERMTLSMPRVQRARRADAVAMNDIQRKLNETVAATLDFFDGAGEESADEVADRINDAMRELAALKLTVRGYAQREMFR